jgi:hypothetical protein
MSQATSNRLWEMRANNSIVGITETSLANWFIIYLTAKENHIKLDEVTPAVTGEISYNFCTLQ